MSSEDVSSHKQTEIGKALERARTGRGLSLWQVEEATKIRARYLHDLERESFDVLPAVYVLGSLKTYADYLGLDGEAMVQELKRRQAPPQEEQDQADEGEPENGERGRLMASFAALVGLGGPDASEVDEDDVPAPASGRGSRPYVGVGAIVVLVLGVALASMLWDEGQPAVSQVREPEISDAPSRIASSGTTRDRGDGRDKGDAGSADDRSEGRTNPPDKGEKDRSEDDGPEEQDRPDDASDVAITPSTPSAASGNAASASAASANATSASTASASSSASASAASIPAATTPASVRAASANATSAAPATAAPGTGEARGTASAQPAAGPSPSGPAPSAVRPAPAAGAAPGGSGSGRAEPGAAGGSGLADRIFGRVQGATNFAR
jgi:hypothetical protein